MQHAGRTEHIQSSAAAVFFLQLATHICLQPVSLYLDDHFIDLIIDLKRCSERRVDSSPYCVLEVTELIITAYNPN